MQDLKPDRKDLKIQALLNKLSGLENENAELRVEIHLLTEEVQELNRPLTEEAEDVPEKETK